MLNNWKTASLQKALRQTTARIKALKNVNSDYKNALISFADSVQTELEFRVVW